ncbi:MAG: FAD-dependent oxidoreductase [Magnetococcales bacterium]|nr:FAD-dependent oxidoreductase [Magnetococcales bacterium]
MTLHPPGHILVLGAGVAGLTAALHLADAGQRPVLLEAAKAAGGRARSWFDPACDEELDNGPHLLMGAYTHTLQLLDRLGTRGLLLEEKTPRFTFWDPALGWQSLRCPEWPAPWHLLHALFRFAPLSRPDCWRVMRLLPDLLRQAEHLEQQSVTQWLARHGQGGEICQRLWYPLCLATLNEPAASANAALFVRVLQRLFLSDRAAARPLLPRRPLSHLFANPARQAILAAGGEVRCQCRVQHLEWSGRTLQALHSSQGVWPRPRAVVIALPHTALARLLPAWAAERQITALHSAPIVSVHLRYPCAATLPVALLGLPLAASQWILDRNRLLPLEEQDPRAPGRFSAVLSGAYRECHWSAQHLIDSVHQDLTRLLPALASVRPAAARVVKEPRATFAAWPGCARYRPGSQTPWENVWLAGDWTATGLPATLEGACQSGREAAQKILDLLARAQ